MIIQVFPFNDDVLVKKSRTLKMKKNHMVNF